MRSTAAAATALLKGLTTNVFGKNDVSNAKKNRRSQKEADDEGTFPILSLMSTVILATRAVQKCV